MARRTPRSKDMASTIWILLILAACGWVIEFVEKTINWLHNFISQNQTGVCVVGAFAIILGVYLIGFRIHKNRTRRMLYRQMLLDFKWHEDMSPTEFEQRCADYLSLKGWKAQTTKESGDQGVDVIAHKAGHVLVLQCKLYSSSIGNKAVQEVYAAKAYTGANMAAVVSNQRYTQSAQELAAKTGVLLMHFTELQSLAKFQ